MSHAISFSIFDNIKSQENGAGLSISNLSLISSVNHCLLINCSTEKFGAAIFVDHCSIPIKYCCISQCKALFAVAICNFGLSDEIVEFYYIATDSCSTIPKGTAGGTLYIAETISSFSNYNSTNNKVNHVATSENANSPSADLKFINSIGNNANKEGVIVQFNTVLSNTLTYSNFVANSCNQYSLIRCYNCSGTVSHCNFISNQCQTIVTQSIIRVIHCYDDGQNIFGTNIESQESSILNIQSKRIECIYFHTQYKTNNPIKYLVFIQSFIFVTKSTIL